MATRVIRRRILLKLTKKLRQTILAYSAVLIKTDKVGLRETAPEVTWQETTVRQMGVWPIVKASGIDNSKVHLMMNYWYCLRLSNLQTQVPSPNISPSSYPPNSCLPISTHPSTNNHSSTASLIRSWV